MLFQIGFASFADLDPGRATGLKDASRLRSIDRIRLSPGDATAAPQGRIGSRNGRNEGFGVGMGRPAADRLAGAGLDNPAAIHDGDPVAHVTDDPEVMGDEQVGQGELLLERLQEIEDLRLDRDVEGGHGLIGDDQPGPEDEGAGDPDPLSLAAAEFMGYRDICSSFRPTTSISSRVRRSLSGRFHSG